MCYILRPVYIWQMFSCHESFFLLCQQRFIQLLLRDMSKHDLKRGLSVGQLAHCTSYLWFLTACLHRHHKNYMPRLNGSWRGLKGWHNRRGYWFTHQNLWRGNSKLIHTSSLKVLAWIWDRCQQYLNTNLTFFICFGHFFAF